MTNILSSSGGLDYPQYFPETSIDFLNNRSIPPEYRFTRNSAGTYVGADGLIKTAAANEPRFDYDPITGEFKGLLVEESRRNLFTQSLGSQHSSINGVSVLNNDSSIIAPDGTTTATKYTPTSPSNYNEHNITWESGNRCPTISYNTRYIVSYFVKPDPDTIAFDYGPRVTVHFSTHQLWFKTAYGRQRGKVYNRNSTTEITSIIAIPYPNDWWRVYVPVFLSGTGTYPFRAGMYLQYDNGSGGALTWTATESNQSNGRIWFWGWQLEEGSFPTSYIPTSGSAVTRQPDQLVLNRPFNSLGTFFVEAIKTTGTTLSADNGTSSIIMSSTGKEALYYNTNRTLRMLSDSIPSLINTTQPPQDLNRISLGFDRLNNTNYINGYLKKFMYYGSPVTEDNLRSLTGNTRETFRYNNDIVTDGLVLNLDAGNRASYPGSGTTWFDLSGSGNDGTLVNGVGYSDSSLVLDGTNDFISNINPNLLEAQVEDNLTYEYWLQPTQSIYNSFTQSTSGTAYFNIGTPQGLVSQSQYKYTNQTFAALLFSFGTNGFVAAAHNNGYAPPFLVDYQTYNGISHLVVIKNVYGCSYYVNGVFKKTATQSKILGVVPNLITSNRSSNFGTYFKGNIYSYKLYSKALTPQEIQQNFNALRGRFGI